MLNKRSRLFLLSFFLFASLPAAFSQVAINSSSSLPHASAMLDISSTTKGLLAPRMTTAQRAAISSPAEGLLIYQTDAVKGFYYYTGSAWSYIAPGSTTNQWGAVINDIYYTTGNVGIGTSTPGTALHVNGTNPLTLGGVQTGNNTDSLLTIVNGVVKRLSPSALTTSSNNAWALVGNGNTTSGSHFIGTTDNKSLRFRSNNVQRLWIDSLGSVGIGTAPTFTTGTYREKFLVDAGTTTSYNVISAKGTINNYLQLNIQNKSNGGAASSDIVATADNGDESTNYVDLGINSSGNTANYFGGANDAYLYNVGQNLLIGTGTASKMLAFLTGGGTQSTNERMRIDGNGNVGIGVTDAANTLVVKDIMEIRRVGSMSSLYFSNTAGTGDFRIGGDGADLYWQGGGGRNLQMGSYWTTVLGGDRQNGTLPSFMNGTGGTGVLALGQRDASVPFAVQGNSATQTANLMEWRNASGTALNIVDANGNVGIGTTTASTKLHVNGTNPLTLGGLQAGTAADSVLTVSNGVVKRISPSLLTNNPNYWSKTGNTGTPSGSYFLGITDNTSLRFRTNNTQSFMLDSLGNAAIGASPTFTAATNREKLLVDAGTTSSYNLIAGKGTINNYLQLNIQNRSNGTAASSDIVASADNATETANFVNLGINSSGYFSTGILAGANKGYLYSTGSDFAIGNAAASKDLLLFTNGTDATDEKMRITSDGYVGIGTTSPQKPLHVNGEALFNTSITVDNSGANNAALKPGLVFGPSGSGEGISSKRTLLGNTYGLDFYTNNTNRIAIANGGNVGIGTTSPGYKLTVAGITAPSADNSYSLGTLLTRWSLVYSANGVTQTSDRRLKTNIAPLGYGLKEVLAMKPVSYNWKEKPGTDPKVGLIAQEVKQLVPEVVVGDETKENLAMNYAELVPVLINAIQEQQKQIEELKKTVQSLRK